MRLCYGVVSTRSKILVLMASVLAFTLGACALVIFRLVDAGRDLQAIAERDVPLMRVLSETTAGHLEQSIRVERALRFAWERGDGVTGGAGYRTARSEFSELSAQIWQNLQRGRELASGLGVGAPDLRSPEIVSELLERADHEHNEYAHSVREAFSLIDRGDVAGGVELVNGMRSDDDHFDEALAELLLQIGGRVEAAAIEAKTVANRAVWVVSVLSVVGIGLTTSAFAYCARLVSEARSLRGLVPICASCKRIRDDGGSWNQLEAYVEEHSEAEFTHGICAECLRDLEIRTLGGSPRTPRDLSSGIDSALG
jgi:hypothetical protein